MDENKKEADTGAVIEERTDFSNPKDSQFTVTPDKLQAMRNGKSLGIKRLSGLALVIPLVALFVFGGVWFWSNFTNQNESANAEEDKPKTVASTEYAANVIMEQKREGLMKPEPKPLVMPTLPQSGGMATPLPPPQPMRSVRNEPARSLPVKPQLSEEQKALRQARYQAFSQAVNASTSVDTGRDMMEPSGRTATVAGSVTPNNSLTQQYTAKLNEARNRLAQLQNGSRLGGGLSSQPMQLVGAGNIRSAVDERVPNSDAWTLDSKVATPTSPYELKTGFVMPATLVTGINSDLPGKIVAQVTQNVYDTATGRHLLIPQGTRLWGTYSNQVAFGQERVLVAWNRLIFPDGKALDIGEMPGATGAGYSGLKDQVNNHYFRLFGAALMMSAITAGITYSQDNNDDDNYDDGTSASDAMSEALGQQLGQTAAQLIQRHLNVAPTLEIRPGFRFNVIVTKDIAFNRPYKSFDY